ncbi:GNAT family N-acetyltransferase [Luteipulveratus mongoliensis]|uniref:GNAT family N-acetyltransferase n=1 Tax=Luteipulveratus mongoliensis TaxID=571913 RepID=UPI001FDF1821|nr:GNAT family N-acetyltransferase [Luteipulveratus mongoliensis]
MSTFTTLGPAAATHPSTAQLTYITRRLQALGHRVRAAHADVSDVDISDGLIVAALARSLMVNAVDALRSSHARAVLIVGGHDKDIAETARRLQASSERRSVILTANPVAAQQILPFNDGGFVLASAAATSLRNDVERLLAHVTGEQRSTGGTKAQDPAPIVARRVSYDAPELAELLADLRVEYATRYARDTANTTLTEVPPTDFVQPHGTFVVLVRSGRTLAGGAIRRLDASTAEIKRVWTTSEVRRQGFGRRVIDELELAASDLGYTRIFLSTGPRQPEARALYLAAGYSPGFDLDAAPEAIGRHVFTKTLRQTSSAHGAA